MLQFSPFLEENYEHLVLNEQEIQML